MKIETATYYCDICGNKIDHKHKGIDSDKYPSTVSENQHFSIEEIKINVYYGGVRTAKDLCRGCSKGIEEKLRELQKNNNILEIGERN